MWRTLKRALTQIRSWEWILLAVCLGLMIYGLSGCSGLAQTWNTISGHLTMVLFGIGAGILVAVLMGVAVLPAAAAGGGGSVATIMAQPPCPPTQVTNINQPTGPINVSSALGQRHLGMPFWFWILFGVWLTLTIRSWHWWLFFFSAQARGYRLRILWHIYFGGKPSVIPPQFLPDLAKEPS